MQHFSELVPWAILAGHVALLLLLDLFVLHRKEKMPSVRRAIGETIFFVANALAFTGVVYWVFQHGDYTNVNGLNGWQAVTRYLSGYTIELSLSVDNLFVIAMVFANYKIPGQYQHRLLFLGILGAIVFRGILIAFGLALMHHIEGITIFFGAFLLYTAFKMLRKEGEESEGGSPKGLTRFFNIHPVIDGHKFRTVVDGKKVFTLLFGALLTIEFTDLLFALDSIPAIFAVTTDPYLVFSSNIFAIMGLRSLYFFLAHLLDRFKKLKYSIFAILVFVALKLIAAPWLEIPEWFSLMFIATALGMGIAYSLAGEKQAKPGDGQ